MIAVMWAQQKEVTGCKAAKYCGKSTDFNQTKLHLNADSVSDSYLHSVVLVVVIVYTHTHTHTFTHTHSHTHTHTHMMAINICLIKVFGKLIFTCSSLLKMPTKLYHILF